MSFLSLSHHLPLVFCLCVCFSHVTSPLLLSVSLSPFSSHEQLVDYVVVAGLKEGASGEGEGHQVEPVTDITVIARGLGEQVPLGFTVIEKTLGGHPAVLTTGLLNNPALYLCYRRGFDKPPIVELG